MVISNSMDLLYQSGFSKKSWSLEVRAEVLKKSVKRLKSAGRRTATNLTTNMKYVDIETSWHEYLVCKQVYFY